MLGRYDIFEGLIGKGSCEGREPKGASLAVHSVSKLKYRHSPGQEAETHAILNMLSRELRYLASARSTAEKSSRNSREIEICRGSIDLFYSWSISLIAFFRTVSSISLPFVSSIHAM
jgi:hypothetical protein